MNYLLIAVGVVLAATLGVAASLALGALAGAVAALAGLGCVAVTGAGTAARVLGAAAATDHLDIEPADGDPAYRSYLFGPVGRDLCKIVVDAARRTWARTVSWSDGDESLAQWVVDTWAGFRARGWSADPRVDEGRTAATRIFLAPAMAAGVLGVVAGTAVGAALAAVVLVVFGLLVAVAVTGALAGAGLLALWELASLRLRGISLECGHCHRPVTAPAYDCDGCPTPPPARHLHLVPGRLGVLDRTCRCGTRLPTLLLRGKSRLEGFCPHASCGHPLPVKGMTAPTFHVPVVAATSTGKTILMAATVDALDAAARADGAGTGLEFAEQTRAAEVADVLDRLRADGADSVAKTLPELPLRALNLYLGDARGRRLLYLYDAAGERYETTEGTDTLRFLRYTDGVVFVVDPFAIDAVRTTVPASDLTTIRPSLRKPAEAVERFGANLRERLGIEAGRRIDRPAAVVVTECDALLASESVAHPYEDGVTGRGDRSAAVRAWLRTVGAGSVVDHVDTSYRRTGYFAVSALAAFEEHARTSARTGGPVADDDPADPVRWLLAPREAS